jgi:predicted DCC family thiol-disulfide oxidoreductase YuxK
MKREFLIYDQDCPLCVKYTEMFVRFGFIKPEERISFSEAEKRVEIKFELPLAMDKIALVDSSNQKALYGIDSLISVLSRKWKWVNLIGNLTPIHFLLEMLYAFISFNRKIFMPVDCNLKGSCTPSRNWFWRIVLILVTALVVNFTVTHYFTKHLNSYFIGNPIYGDSIYFGFQFLFQGTVLWFTKNRNYYEYFGHLAFVSFLGALLLGFFDLGLQVLNYMALDTQLLTGVCYGIVYLFMLYEHARRIKIIHVSTWLSFTWIAYRLILYPFAFKFF